MASAPPASIPSFELDPPLLNLLPVFNAQPGATLLLSPEWVIVGASDDYLAATLTERAAIVGQHIFDAFPDNPATPEANAVANVRASLEMVLATKQPHDMAPQHYDVPDRTRPGHFVERHWKPRHTPVLDAAGEVQFIVQSVEDITATRLTERLLRESRAGEQLARADAETQRQRFHEVLLQLPAYVAVYHGPDHVYQFVNPPYQRRFPHRAFLGRPLREATPETLALGLAAVFDRVYQTGEPFYAQELEGWFDFHGTGQPEQIFLNFFLHPLRDAQGRIDGVLDFSYDVSEQVRARRQVEKLNQKLEAHVQQRTQETDAARADAERQQARLEQLFRQAPAAICILDGPDLVYQLVNPGYQQLFPGRALQGRPLLEALPELVGQPVWQTLRQVYDTGRSHQEWGVCVPVARHEGGPLEDFYFNYVQQPRYGAHGRVDGVVVFAFDVTEQVRHQQRAAALQAEVLAAAQRQAREREAFHAVFEQTPALIALLRAPGHRFEYLNPAYKALFPGRPLLGLDVAVAVPEMQQQGFVALLDHVYRSGETYFGAEVPFELASAGELVPRWTYYNFTMQAYREAGAIAGVSIFSFDVTEQVLARREQEAQRQELEQLFMQAPTPVVILDGPDLVFQLVNPAYQRIFPGRALADKPLLEALPELVGTPIPDLFQRVYETGEPVVVQELPLMMARHEGHAPEEIYWTFAYQARRAAHGAIDGVRVFAHDVTEQVRTRQQVQELNEALAAINEELTASNEELGDSNRQLTRTNVDLDNFIYTASHDLKAPISNIEGLLLALEHELPATGRVGDVPAMLAMMQGATDRFKRTIEHLTEVSRLQKEHGRASEHVPLAAVIEAVRLDLLPLLQQSQAQLDVQVPASLTVTFAEKNLRSVVYNLLSNALKYRHPDRVPRVRLSCQSQGDYQVLEVQDNGLDLAQGQDKLFAMFQRLHTHVEGTGIGLYMVKKIVENAGGHIEVESQLGQGTTFRVCFLR